MLVKAATAWPGCDAAAGRLGRAPFSGFKLRPFQEQSEKEMSVSADSGCRPGWGLVGGKFARLRQGTPANEQSWPRPAGPRTERCRAHRIRPEAIARNE